MPNGQRRKWTEIVAGTILLQEIPEDIPPDFDLQSHVLNVKFVCLY